MPKTKKPKKARGRASTAKQFQRLAVDSPDLTVRGSAEGDGQRFDITCDDPETRGRFINLAEGAVAESGMRATGCDGPAAEWMCILGTVASYVAGEFDFDSGAWEIKNAALISALTLEHAREYREAFQHWQSANEATQLVYRHRNVQAILVWTRRCAMVGLRLVDLGKLWEIDSVEPAPNADVRRKASSVIRSVLELEALHEVRPGNRSDSVVKLDDLAIAASIALSGGLSSLSRDDVTEAWRNWIAAISNYDLQHDMTLYQLLLSTLKLQCPVVASHLPHVSGAEMWEHLKWNPIRAAKTLINTIDQSLHVWGQLDSIQNQDLQDKRARQEYMRDWHDAVAIAKAVDGAPPLPKRVEDPRDCLIDLRTWLAEVINGLHGDARAHQLAEENESGLRDRIARMDGNAHLSAADLARSLNVDGETLRKRLERFRDKSDVGWIENTERKSREPQYLYVVKHIRHILESMDASGETSDERPLKKI